MPLSPQRWLHLQRDRCACNFTKGTPIMSAATRTVDGTVLPATGTWTIDTGPLARRVHRPPPGGRQDQGSLRHVVGHGRDRRGADGVVGHAGDRRGQHRHQGREPRQPPPQRRLPRRREVPEAHVHQHERDGQGDATGWSRATSPSTASPGRSTAGRSSSTAWSRRTRGASPGSAYSGSDRDRPRGLRPHVERGPGDRRRAGRQDREARASRSRPSSSG